MEDIFDTSNVPWISEETIRPEKFFSDYKEIIKATLRGNALDSREDIRKHFPPPPQGTSEDPFDVEKLEEGCSVDLLNVEEEILGDDIAHPTKKTARVQNWYAGSYKDVLIPKEGEERLHTLAAQAKEKHMRETVAGYAVLRRRQFKYNNIVRLAPSEFDSRPTNAAKNDSIECLDEIVINMRVHRPFHRKVYWNKVSNPFPKCSQEILVLGSQKLSEIRDSIICINDLSIWEDCSQSPDLKDASHKPNASKQMSSGFMYINKVFYIDMRHPDAVDYSEGIKTWAQKRKEIGPMQTKKMEETYIKDLELQLGYPYVYVHLGCCEHLITFTDIRLIHKQDMQDPSCYPLHWGQPCNITARCCICSVSLANWIAEGDNKLPLKYSLLCDRCLKTFCYNSEGKKNNSALKVYPFMDEIILKQKKYMS